MSGKQFVPIIILGVATLAAVFVASALLPGIAVIVLLMALLIGAFGVLAIRTGDEG